MLHFTAQELHLVGWIQQVVNTISVMPERGESVEEGVAREVDVYTFLNSISVPL